NGRSTVTEPPQRDLLDGGAGGNESINRRAQIAVEIFEARRRALAITHSPAVEPHARNAPRGQKPRQMDELAMPARAVLSTADHDEDSYRERRVRCTEHAQQPCTLAIEQESTLRAPFRRHD